jgi:ribosomal protein S18 acetylase RimI-like enzyme
VIARVEAGRIGEAVDRLIGAEGDRLAIDQFIEQADADRTDLSLMWATFGRSDRSMRQVCLAIPNAGKTVGVFPGAWSARAGELLAMRIERGALLEHVSRAVRDEAGLDMHLAQALLEPDDREGLASFQAGGYQRLADLAYLRRVISHGGRHEPLVWPEGVRVASLRELPEGEGERLLRSALERSYEGTLDCPALCGLRELDDVVASHRAVGVYDPRLWWVVLHRGEPWGCMLVNAGVSHETAELVYLGLGPAARGKGLGAGLLKLAMAALSRRQETVLACAVDTQNTPARRLYERAGFRQFALRVAVVRSLRPHAGG